MNAKNLIKGLEIFVKYNENFYPSADHDVLFGPHRGDYGFTIEELEILHLSGWYINSDGYWCSFL